MGLRVGSGSERDTLFSSGYFYMGIRKENRRLNQQGSKRFPFFWSLRFQKTTPAPTKNYCAYKSKCVFQRAYKCQMNNIWKSLSFALQGTSSDQCLCCSFPHTKSITHQNQCRFYSYLIACWFDSTIETHYLERQILQTLSVA